MRMAPKDHPRLPQFDAVKPPLSERRTPQGRLLRCLLHLAGPSAHVESVASRHWASATFQGSRHLIELRFGGAAAEAAAATFAERAPISEYAISGHIVADVSVESVEVTPNGTAFPGATVTLSALTVEDW